MADDAVQAWLDRAARAPIPSKQQQLLYARAYRRGQQPDATPREQKQAQRAKDRMIAGNLKLIVPIAKKFLARASNGTGLSLEDLLQAGSLGLIRAVEKYDPELGYAFSTYAFNWVRQAIAREIELNGKAIRPTSGAHAFARRWRYRPEGQSKEDFAAEHGYTLQQVERELSCLNRWSISSLDVQLTHGRDREGAALHELIPDPNSCNDLEHLDSIHLIEDLRQRCPQELQLVELSVSGVSRTEIAAAAGVTQQMVAHQLMAARATLRAATLEATTTASVGRQPQPLIERMATNNGTAVEALEQALEAPSAEPVKARRRRRSKAELEATGVKPKAVPAATVKLKIAGVEVEASAADAITLLRGLSNAA